MGVLVHGEGGGRVPSTRGVRKWGKGKGQRENTRGRTRRRGGTDEERVDENGK